MALPEAADDQAVSRSALPYAEVDAFWRRWEPGWTRLSAKPWTRAGTPSDSTTSRNNTSPTTAGNTASFATCVAHSQPRDRPANKCARAHDELARDLTAWWADAAVVALRCAVAGTSVAAARLAAADPTRMFDDHEMAELPPVDEQTRQLVELAADMGPMHTDGYEASDLREEAAELARETGLTFGYGMDGRVRP